MFETKEEIIEVLYNAIPYSNQIKKLDISSEEDAIRFEWRGTRYRVSVRGGVEEIGNGVLTSSDSALLVETLLNKTKIMSDGNK